MALTKGQRETVNEALKHFNLGGVVNCMALTGHHLFKKYPGHGSLGAFLESKLEALLEAAVIEENGYEISTLGFSVRRQDLQEPNKSITKVLRVQWVYAQELITIK